MADDVGDIQAFYDRSVELEHGRLDRHQIERDVTWRYLEKYLPSGGRILDIGAATGAYAIPLAKRGYGVTAVDLSPELIDLCGKRVVEEGLGSMVTCLVADASDLGVVTDTDYDAVLLMGPLYHLVLEEDRITALRQAWKKLKPGGVIFSALISRYGIWGNVLRRMPDLLESQALVTLVFEKGRDVELPIWKQSFRGYFAMVDEVVPLHEQIGFKTLVLAGVEPVGTGADESYGSLEGQKRQLWLDLLFSISTEKSIIGVSEHLLYIGKKEASA